MNRQLALKLARDKTPNDKNKNKESLVEMKQPKKWKELALAISSAYFRRVAIIEDKMKHLN